MEELTNALMRFMMNAKKACLMNIEHAHNVFVSRMEFELKRGIGGDVYTKS